MAQRSPRPAHQPAGEDGPPAGPVDIGGPSVGVPPAESPRPRRRKTGHGRPAAPELPAYARDWAGMRHETRATSALRPFPGNARLHDANQLAQIARSFEEFGFTTPLLVDEADTILAGHGRWEAAKLAALDVLPVVVAEGWTVEQKRAYVIADNQIALNASWDMTALRAELSDLTDAGADMTLTGLSFDRIGEILELKLPENGAPEAWNGMPEFDQSDKTAFRTIPVHFRSQEDVDAFAALIKQAISPKTRYVWFPNIEIERLADKRYVADK